MGERGTETDSQAGRGGDGGVGRVKGEIEMRRGRTGGEAVRG